MHVLDKFFEPSSLAVIGASADLSRMGGMVMNTLTGGKFKGNIYPVNRKGGQMFGLTACNSIADIPEIPDLAIIIVPAAAVYRALEECADKGIKSVIVITAGFAELGEEGNSLQGEFTGLSKRNGMAILGPNCYGAINPSANLFATFAQSYPPPGGIGIISQSGNLGMQIAANAAEIGFGTSKFVGTGNEAVLHCEDFLDYLASDDQTKVILSYIEGIRNGRGFFEIARKTTRNKPFVMIKGGVSLQGAQAARSHSASLSSPDHVIDAMCRQAGIIRAGNSTELQNIGIGFLSNPLPKGNRVGMSTTGGGLGVLASDACIKNGFQVVNLSDELLKELDSILPPYWSRSNPVDITVSTLENQIKVLEVLARSNEVDCMMVLGAIGWNMEMSVNSCLAIKKIVNKYHKPIYLRFKVLFPHKERGDFLEELGKHDIANYNTAEEAVTVMKAMLQYRKYLQKVQTERETATA